MKASLFYFSKLCMKYFAMMNPAYSFSSFTHFDIQHVCECVTVCLCSLSPGLLVLGRIQIWEINSKDIIDETLRPIPCFNPA